MPKKVASLGRMLLACYLLMWSWRLVPLHFPSPGDSTVCVWLCEMNFCRPPLTGCPPLADRHQSADTVFCVVLEVDDTKGMLNSFHMSYQNTFRNCHHQILRCYNVHCLDSGEYSGARGEGDASAASFIPFVRKSYRLPVRTKECIH